MRKEYKEQQEAVGSTQLERNNDSSNRLLKNSTSQENTGKAPEVQKIKRKEWGESNEDTAS